MEKIDINSVAQICVVVNDLEKKAKNYCEIFNVEMPEIFIVPPGEISHAKYLRKPTKARARLVVFKMGSIRLELLEPDKEYPSVWRDFLDTHGEGIHNITFAVNNLNKKLQGLDSMGMPLLHIGEYEPGRCYANVDTYEKLGMIINLKD